MNKTRITELERYVHSQVDTVKLSYDDAAVLLWIARTAYAAEDLIRVEDEDDIGRHNNLRDALDAFDWN